MISIKLGTYTPPEKEEPIEKIAVTIGLFFDGTLNNKTNVKEGKNNTSISDKYGGKDTSYDNEYSNIARLWKGYDKDDQGIVTLKNGEHVTVEFFKIRGGGAVHEKITKNAAKRAGVPYDYRLDEGCACPDVPCGDVNSVETCYYRTWRDLDKEGTLAYRSHHGDLQYWHSMAPTGKNTNEQVVNKIINQAQKWFKKAVETPSDKDEDDGLFHIGKILHMVQDSYSLSHVQRDAENKIIQIQSYNEQDEHKHGEPDKDGESKGAKDAEDSSFLILKHYKETKQKSISPTVKRDFV